jgi:hypothetical protein
MWGSRWVRYAARALVGPRAGRDAFVQRVRCQVRTAGPHDGAGLGMCLDLAEALRGTRLLEHRAAHPPEDVHVTGEPIVEVKTENAVADHGGLGYARRQANRRSGSIG